MTNKRLSKSIKKFSRKKEDRVITISGMLGLPLNGAKTVSVPNRDGFVFVRLKDNTSEVIQAYNSEVSPIYDLPVLVTRQGNVYKVIGRNLTLYRDWGSVPYLPKHGGQHSFNVALGIGGDITWVFSQQFMPLLGYPSGTSMMLTVEPHVYEWEGQWKYAQNTGTPSFAPFVPTSGAMARMALLYIDGRDNSLNIAAGESFSNLITDPATLFTFLPDVPRSIGIPIAGVKLPTGTTSLEWTNVYDVRDFYTVGMSSGSAASNSIFVWDEGVLKGTATTLNVVGALADISVSGSVARLFITGSGGGSNPNVQDEGVPLGTADTFNFVGAGVSTSISGTTAQINIPSSGLSCGGRLSLVSGTAITTTNQTGSHIWLVPYMADTLSVYNGTVWIDVAISSPFVAVPSIATGTFDIFAFNNGGSISLETVNWTDDVTRATALSTQNGRLVKSGDSTRRYIGTGRTTASGQCEDTDAKRFLWNYCNRVNRRLKRIDTTANWTVTAGTPLRRWNNSSLNRVEFVIGVSEEPVYLEFLGLGAVTSGGTFNVGIGLDSTTTNSADVSPATNSTITVLTIAMAKYRSTPIPGYHFLQLLEFGNSASDTLFFGLVAAFGGQSGAVGYLDG